MTKIGAVINPNAGPLTPEAANERLREIRGHLEARVEPGWLAIVAGPRVGPEIERLKGLGAEVIVVGGGDGTISTAAQILVDTPIALAVLGLGTRNHFARDLGVPLEPVEAIQLLDRMQVSPVDLGEVNGRVFINNAALGPYPRLVQEREWRMQTRGWRKWQAEIAAALVVLWRMRQLRLLVEENQNRTKLRTPLLFVGNNQYTGGILADSKRPSITDGHLWFCTARALGLWSLLRMAWQLGAGGIDQIEDLETRLLTAVTVIPRRRRVTVAVDGENLRMDAPLRFRTRPGSLRVVVP
jgi:diacylglycerol kinase family enzyme